MSTIIDFESSENCALFNPRLSASDLTICNTIARGIQEHTSLILLATSGSTAQPKIVALKKENFLIAARAVNTYLEATAADSWLNPLPLFHVGGLSILARSVLSGAALFSLATWNPKDFCEQLTTQSIAFTSLVPTQLFDLIEAQMRAPSTLKGVLIGGGSLHSHLAERALLLGWPLIHSFGMSESSAAVAMHRVTAASILDGSFHYVTPLPHVTCGEGMHGNLTIKSQALFEGYYTLHEDRIVLDDPKKDGWFHTEDLVSWQQSSFKPLGRMSNTIKIRGELLNTDVIMHKASAILRPEALSHCILFAAPDTRTGHKLILAYEAEINLAETITAFNAILPPFAQIADTIQCPILPRTSLGKIQVGELQQRYLHVSTHTP
jgi:O-succinylbenzoic acid--CoA ligase